MYKKINWIAWLALVVLWNYGFPQATPFQDVIVAVFLSILFIIIHLLQSRYLKKVSQEVSSNKMKDRLLWEYIMITNLLVAPKQ